MEYLGHVITPEGLQPNPKQASAIRDYPAPESVSQMCQFLGMTSYRRFIKEFAKIAFPLHGLTMKSATFIWTTQCQKSFELLKEKLTCAPSSCVPRLLQTVCAGDRCEHQRARGSSLTEAD